MNGKTFVSLFCSCICAIAWSVSYIVTTFGTHFEKWWIYPLMLTDTAVMIVSTVSIGSWLENRKKGR